VTARLTALVCAIVIAFLYFWHIGTAPIYLYHDEVMFAVQSHAIAMTLQDVSGTFLPLYIHMPNSYWCSPEHIYLSALLFRFVPVSDAVIRIPTVAAGLLSVVLTYFVGRAFFRSSAWGIAAAVMMALTPALFLASRYKVESHFPLPFVLAWMLCLLRSDESRRRAWMIAAPAMLGLGIYSYHASPAMMSLYALFTVALVWIDTRRVGPAAIVALVFACFLLPYVVFLLRHPEYLRDEVATYQMAEPGATSVLRSFAHLANWTAVKTRIAVYFDYFSPSSLFFSGGSSLLDTTRHVGVLLLPLAVLLPVGIGRLIARRDRMSTLMLFGLLTAPVAAVIVGEAGATRRILFFLPFVAIAATTGLRSLIESRVPLRRLIGAALLVGLPLQFASFYRDYMGDYRTRSAYWFEYNIQGALASAVEAAAHADQATTIAIDGHLPMIEWHWRYCLIKHGRMDLRARTHYFVPPTMTRADFPAGTIVVANADAREKLSKLPITLSEISHTREPDGATSYYVLASR
jgi:4-amino-4-deoxy-L-arabinose transferase-like glycosyltransferase